MFERLTYFVVERDELCVVIAAEYNRKEAENQRQGSKMMTEYDSRAPKNRQFLTEQSVVSLLTSMSGQIIKFDIKQGANN